MGASQWIGHSTEKEQVWKGPKVGGHKVHSLNKESAVWVETSRPPAMPSALG